MLSYLIDNILRIIFKELYRSKLNFLVEIINVLLSTAIYYFTSKAFGASLATQTDLSNMTYFQFIMLGDLFLIFPAYFLEGSLSSYRKSMIDDTFRTLSLLPIGQFKSYLTILAPTLMLSLYRALSLLFVFTIFSNDVTFLISIRILLLLIISVLIFAPLSFLTTSFFLCTGRGQGMAAFLSTFFSVFSGGYFPVEIFPDWIGQLMLNFNPMAFYLSSFRLFAIAEGSFPSILQFLLFTIVLSLSYFAFFRVYLKAFNFWRKNGRLSVLTR